MGPVNTQGSIDSQKIYSDLSSVCKKGDIKNPEGFPTNLSSVINISEDKPILTKPESLTSSSEKKSDTLLTGCITKIKSVFGMSTNRQVNSSGDDAEKEVFLEGGKIYKMTLENERDKKNNGFMPLNINLNTKKSIVVAAMGAAVIGGGYLAYQSLFGENSSHDGWLPDALKPDNSTGMSTIAGLEEGISQVYSGWQSENADSPGLRFSFDNLELASSGDGYDYGDQYGDGYDGEYGDDYDGIDGSGDKIYI